MIENLFSNFLECIKNVCNKFNKKFIYFWREVYTFFLTIFFKFCLLEFRNFGHAVTLTLRAQWLYIHCIRPTVWFIGNRIKFSYLIWLVVVLWFLTRLLRRSTQSPMNEFYWLPENRTRIFVHRIIQTDHTQPRQTKRHLEFKRLDHIYLNTPVRVKCLLPKIYMVLAAKSVVLPKIL